MKSVVPLVFSLLLLAAAGVAQAQFTFTTNDGGIVITGYSGLGLSGSLTIPSSTNGLPIIGIAEHAFIRSLGPTSVTIPASVTTIGETAFASCPDLTNVTILPGGLTSIGDLAFSNCVNLANFTIPEGVTSIGLGAFAGAGLTNVTIPGGLTNFGTNAFADCRSLTNATIGYGVTNVAPGAFANCTSLDSIRIPPSVASIGVSAFYACYHFTNFTIPPSVTNIETAAFWFCTNIAGLYFTGNAPAVAGDVFDHDTQATAYYLPGTTGWTSFASQSGLTPVLWNLAIQNGASAYGSSFGVRNGQFGFDVAGTARIPFVVEVCTNLASRVWTPLTNATISRGVFYFSEPMQTNSTGRFFRISPP
jgi:hypothetical protein